MIVGYVGRKGHGKTINMVWDAMNVLYRGGRVITNTPIEGWYKPFLRKRKYLKAKFIQKGEEFLEAVFREVNCTICIDEAAIFVPSYYWSKIPSELLVKFHEERKFNSHIWYTTQGFGHAVARLRDLTDYVKKCTRTRFLFSRTYTMKTFYPEYFKGAPTENKYKMYHLGTRVIFPSDQRRLFNCYNTKYIIDYSPMMKTKKFKQMHELDVTSSDPKGVTVPASREVSHGSTD